MTIRFDVRRCLSILAAVLMVAVVSAPVTSHAQEARCTALGANCICSEPMNTSTFTSPVANWSIGFPDGGTRKCAYLGNAGAVGEMPPDARAGYFMSNTASVINALTNTGTPAFVFSGVNSNSGGALLFGHTDLPSVRQARVALRWYKYYSPNFQLNGRGDVIGCYNSGKEAVLQLYSGTPTLGAVIQTNNQQFGYTIYSFGSPPWGPGGFDCCNPAPGWDSFANLLNTTWDTANDLQGRWLRHEYVISNAGGGPGMTMEYYITDVTRGRTRLNNGNEWRVMDSRITCSGQNYPAGCGQGPTASGWTTAMATRLDPGPGAFIRAINVDGFRANTGSCAGFAAYSYLMAASWNTNAGQRIGAASEIESGPRGAVPGPPDSLTLR